MSFERLRRDRIEDLEVWSRWKANSWSLWWRRSERVWIVRRLWRASRTYGRSGVSVLFVEAAVDLVWIVIGKDEVLINTGAAERILRALARRVDKLAKAF